MKSYGILDATFCLTDCRTWYYYVLSAGDDDDDDDNAIPLHVMIFNYEGRTPTEEESAIHLSSLTTDAKKQ